MKPADDPIGEPHDPLNPTDSGLGKLVFTSERLENFDNSWRAKEIRSSDEFIEIVELGAPGKVLAVYTRNHFKRAKP